MEAGIYALLQPARLLDLLAHFVVFERDPDTGSVTKKIARYQQFRAVNKMVGRVLEGKHRQGLVWHTQGSGKSLTMVFAALKLKFHRGITSERLQNPNLLLLTDRVDLHRQISQTFERCGFPNPREASAIDDANPDHPGLRQLVTLDAHGLTVLSTIYKMQWKPPGLGRGPEWKREAALDTMAAPHSDRWIVLVDECHRTQEKALGAYLKAALPRAVRFGFTGTPIKKDDKDTYANFGVPGESYLDRCTVEDAVADGATVPVFYQARMTDWHMDDRALDVHFDQTFGDLPEEKKDEIQRRGVTVGDLARLKTRIGLIAEDIWAHYRSHVAPGGMKGQIVAIDRLACVAYKEALDAVIARTYRKLDGLDEDQARALAARSSAAIYTPGQHDSVQHPELVRHQLDEQGERDAIARFKDPTDPLRFLVVCNKLLTGFDAPIEGVMYLDSPLSDHNLLQAIARTNRTWNGKGKGVVVDYVGVSRKLARALAAYKVEDVAGAWRDYDALADALRAAWKSAMELFVGIPRTGNDYKDAEVASASFHAEDRGYELRLRVRAFQDAFAELSPDPRILPYMSDLKYVTAVLALVALVLEKSEEVDLATLSAQIRALLQEHLEVTGIRTACKLRSLDDEGFWEEFKQQENQATAAIKKLAELKKETTDRSKDAPHRYGRFSERIAELLAQLQQGLIDAAEALNQAEQVAREVDAERKAHVSSGLDERCYGLWRLLVDAGAPDGDGGKDLARAIDLLYTDPQEAPALWQDKPELRRELRGKVRRLLRTTGLVGWKDALPAAIDEHAGRHYARLAEGP